MPYERPHPQATREPTLDEIKEFLRSAWRELLSLPGLGDEDDFFLSGGNSIMAAIVATRLSRFLGYRVSSGEIFFHFTIQDLAEVVWKSTRNE
jgi:Phosphopantetheine attachment site